jgi:hypothetical protein
MLLAVTKPLFNGPIGVPAVVPGQSFDWEHVGIVENFILSSKNSERFTRGFVFVEVVLLFRKERSLLYNYLVLFNDVSVACGQALNSS